MLEFGEPEGFEQRRHVNTKAPPQSLLESVQPPTFYSGAITTKAAEPAAAAALLRFLAAPDAAPVITKAGLAPITVR